jgi:hypothetical protein
MPGHPVRSDARRNGRRPKGDGRIRRIFRHRQIAGTAYAGEEAVGSKREPGAPQAPEPRPAEPSPDDKVDQLERLDELREQGILTEPEFAEQKRRILRP